MISLLSEQVTMVNIRQLILEVSSKWVIDRNVTRKSIINHVDDSCIKFKADSYRSMETITMIGSRYHCYIEYSKLFNAKIPSTNDSYGGGIDYSETYALVARLTYNSSFDGLGRPSAFSATSNGRQDRLSE